jgi:hypothetical protein
MRRRSFLALVAWLALVPAVSSAANGAVKVEGGLVQGVATSYAVHDGAELARA